MRLENYIMEQDINTSTVADIFTEQAQAEFKVALSIADSYAKEVAIMEYYYAEGTILDSATNKGVDESKLKKALLFIPRFFKAIFTRFIALFKKKDIVAAKTMVKNIPDEIKSDVLVPMTVGELEDCMKAIDGVKTLLLGHAGATKGGKGIVGILSDYCEMVYNGSNKTSRDLTFPESTLRSIEIVEKFNLSKIVAKHRARYNELARQTASSSVGTSFKVKDNDKATEDIEKSKKAESLLAPEGAWLGKMPNKNVQVQKPTAEQASEAFADAAKFEEMIKKLDELKADLIQFKKDSEETIKDLEAAIKKDESVSAEKQRPELRNALSEAISICNRVNKAAVHFCDEIEKTIGIEMSIVNEVANVKDFDIKRKGFLGSSFGGGKKGSYATHSGSYSDSYSGGSTNKAKIKDSDTIKDVENKKANSWGLD